MFDHSSKPKTLSFAHEGGQIAFDDTGGSGPLVIGIPGMGDLRSEYRYLRPVLQEAGYRVVTMDVRGFGETSAEWSDYSAHAVGRDALALVKHIDAGPAVILGNSFAAGAALWAAHDAPDQVRGAVLLGPIVRNLPVPWIANAALKIGFGGPWRVWFWTTYWDSLFPTKKPSDQAEVRAAISTNLHEPGRANALQKMLFLSKADTEAMLPEVNTPSLVVMGTKDPDFSDPAQEAQSLTQLIRAEPPLIVQGAGHYPHTEMCEQISQDLLNFIAKAHKVK